MEGESEVQQLEAAVGGAPHHVRGLQVAVGETVGVEGIKSTMILQKKLKHAVREIFLRTLFCLT